MWPEKVEGDTEIQYKHNILTDNTAPSLEPIFKKENEDQMLNFPPKTHHEDLLKPVSKIFITICIHW